MVAAIKREETENKDYVIEGSETITMHYVLVRYSNTFNPAPKISETPLGPKHFPGLFIPKLKTVGMMGAYFKDFKEDFIANETWNEPGKPTLTIETFRTTNH